MFSDGNGWNWINAYDIERRVNKLLPEGFQIASPSFFNFREGTGFALVSRENDAGCCATGGKVYIDFEVADHDLKVSRIAFDETKPVGQTHYAPMEPQDTEAEGDKK